MTYITARDQDYLRQRFASELVAQVTLTLFVRPASRLFIPGQQPGTSRETQQLLEELVTLSDKLSLDVQDVTAEPDVAEQRGVELTPTLIVGDETQRKGTLRFIGSPSGYEFVTVIEDIVDLSTGEPGLTDETVAQLAQVTEPLHIQVFSTPT
jgi:alkyl hydroperoxide reductase subunit AhpF